MANKDNMKLIRQVKDTEGWTCELKKRSLHYKIKSPQGNLYFAASTPSDYRACKNLKAFMKREGMKV